MPRSEQWMKTDLYRLFFFKIDCAIFYTNLHELCFQFISWTNQVNAGKFMDNCWISCEVMANMKKVWDDLIIINLYISSVIRPWCTTTYAEGSGAEKFINFCLVWCDVASRGQEIPKAHWSKLTLIPFLILRTFDHSSRWEMIKGF